jgi:hypothetical protein
MVHELRDDQMDALRGIAAQLNAATAEASLVIQAVDHFLADELCIGVSAASRPFESQRALGDDDRELIITSHLAFGRVQGKDRIYVLKATLEKNEWKENFTKIVAEDRTPWSSCAREVKLQSFTMLPELLANLAARVEDVSNQTTRTVETVRELIDAMKQPPTRPRHASEADFDTAHLHAQAIAHPNDDDEIDEEPEPADVPLEELTVAAAPTLFKRPRPRA